MVSVGVGVLSGTVFLLSGCQNFIKSVSFLWFLSTTGDFPLLTGFLVFLELVCLSGLVLGAGVLGVWVGVLGAGVLDGVL